MKKEIVAMLLAGGQGSRLGVLTSNMAKPAVPFGGKYRIIDFPLSNCTNSEIDTVGVLTQYRPLALNSYLGTGQHWDLDRNNGGVFVLPPYMTERVGQWYSGTANAIYQNREFVDQYAPTYVLILSGDHIYKMDYERMLRQHIESKADATIAVIRVPMEEAHRFGIMNTNEKNQITSFDEKPAHPLSNNASMGIYIFTWNTLKSYLERDERDGNSDHDFGKNIIPTMLGDGRKMIAYPFSGYWKDVGTVQSLWEANMDLLGEPPVLDLDDPAWRIYTRNPSLPAHVVGPNACIENAIVAEGCTVYGHVKNSVLFCGARVDEGAVVEDAVVLPNAHIGRDAAVHKAIIGENTSIGDGSVIGGDLREGETVDNKLTGDITLVGNDVCILRGSYLPQGVIFSVDAGEEEQV